jgi:hypothetical protein
MEVADFILKYGVRSNTLNGKQCKDLKLFSFKMIKIDLPELLSKGDFKGVAKKLLKIDSSNDNELMSFVLWVKDELLLINKIENANLSSPPDPDLIASGIHKLNELGIVATLNGLSEDITKWNKIIRMPYIDVYYKMLLNKRIADIQKNYHKIQTEKAKNKR